MLNGCGRSARGGTAARFTGPAFSIQHCAFSILFDCAEGEKLLVPFPDRGGGGGLEEGEVGDVAELPVEHREDGAGEGGAADLGVGLRGAAREVLLGVEPDADAGADAPAAPLALLGARLGDGFHAEALHAGAGVVAREAGEAGVDDVAHAGDRDGGLGDVRREDDARLPGRELEGAALLGGREAREERDRLDAGQAPPAQRLGRGADVALAGEEDEDVALVGSGEALLHGVRDGGGEVGLLALGRAPAHLDRIGAAGDREDGRAAEEVREGLRLERRGGDDHAQVGTAREDAPQAPEDEVHVERALVGLVHHDRVVGAQERVRAQLREQDAVGHELHAVVARELLPEAVLPPDEVALLAELARDALGDRDGGEAARLGDADEPPLRAAAELEADLRDLGGLAGARLAAHDDDGVRLDRGGDLGAVLEDGEGGARPGGGRHGTGVSESSGRRPAERMNCARKAKLRSRPARSIGCGQRSRSSR